MFPAEKKEGKRNMDLRKLPFYSLSVEKYEKLITN
jgi:hypothetical protein